MMKRTMQNVLLVAGCVFTVVVLSGCTTPLGKAVQKKDYQEVQRLIDAGADINQRYGGRFALLDATLEGNTDMVRLLLENGAELGGTLRKETVLDVAQRKGHQEIVNLLRAEPQRREAERAKNSALREAKKVIKELECASLIQLFQKYSLDNEFVVTALTDALIEAKVTQLPEFLLTASFDQKTVVQVAIEQRLLQSTVALQQCNNEAQGFAELGNTQKATESRNLATSLLAYQAALNAIKTELETY